MSGELYDLTRRVAMLAGEEYGLSEEDTELLFEELLRVVEGETV